MKPRCLNVCIVFYRQLPYLSHIVDLRLAICISISVFRRRVDRIEKVQQICATKLKHYVK